MACKDEQPLGSKRNLHRLLENLNDVHKKDMKEVSGGHLNENKLWQEKQATRQKIWDSANRSPVWMRKKVAVKNHPISKNILPPLEKNVTAMNEAISDFMLGPNDNITKKNKPRKTKLKDKETCERMLSDVRLSKSPKRGGDSSKELIPTHHVMATKQEQYKQLRHIQENLLDHDGNKRKPTIQDIEIKLKKRLNLLEKQQDVSGPNFFKLKIYSDAWDELCEVSETYGDLLKSSKESYDEYINTLLDEQIKMNEPIKNRIHLMTSQKKEESNIKESEEEVKKWEEKVLNELNENERLRKELKVAISNKKGVMSFLEKDNDSTAGSTEEVMTDEPVNDVEQQVHALHAQIELKLFELEELKKDRKENYVPIAMCERLEHCIKETEVDIQKLHKQNEFLEHNIQELEEELEDVLVKTGIKNRPRGYLWKKANTSLLI